MRLHYYPDTDSLYIDLAERPGAQVREVAPGVNLDFDSEGALVGIDIDHASQIVNLSSLETAARRNVPIGDQRLLATSEVRVGDLALELRRLDLPPIVAEPDGSSRISAVNPQEDYERAGLGAGRSLGRQSRAHARHDIGRVP
jgi:uncharacterized protein YuzE